MSHHRNPRALLTPAMHGVLDRMARDMAMDLKDHNVASLSLWQGFTFTERAMENLKNIPGMAEQLKSAVPPEDVGKAVAKAATAPSPKARYFVPKSARTAARMFGMLPDRMADRLLLRMYKWGLPA